MRPLILTACVLGSAAFGDIGFDSYLTDVPLLGLVVERAEFDDAVIEDFRFSNGKKFIYATPGEEFFATFTYHFSSPCAEALHFHYFLVGLYDPDASVCAEDDRGVCDARGVAHIQFRAPRSPGTYQVRFCETKKLSLEEARQRVWTIRKPSDITVMGIVIVTSRELEGPP